MVSWKRKANSPYRRYCHSCRYQNVLIFESIVTYAVVKVEAHMRRDVASEPYLVGSDRLLGSD